MDTPSIEKKPFESNIPNSSELLDDPIIPALNKSKIDAERLADKLNKELEADETIFAKIGGKITDKKNVIAWKTRQEARKDAHKLRGDYPAEKRELSGKLSLEEIIKELEGEEDD